MHVKAYVAAIYLVQAMLQIKSSLLACVVQFQQTRTKSKVDSAFMPVPKLPALCCACHALRWHKFEFIY